MFSYAFHDSFYQNYLFSLFSFLLFCLVFLFFIFTSLFCSFHFRCLFRIACFVCCCVMFNHFGMKSDGSVVSAFLPYVSYDLIKGVNHLSVDNPASNLIKGVNHFSVDNPAHFLDLVDLNADIIVSYDSELQYGNVNHLSVDNFLHIIENVTLNGEADQLVFSTHGYTFTQIVELISRNIFSQKSKPCLSLIFCLIVTILKIINGVTITLSNYRIIETPRRVLIKRKPLGRVNQSRMITLMTLLIFILIRVNETSVADESFEVSAKPFELVNHFTSLYNVSKGRPLRLNFFMLLILSGDIETNPGPRGPSNKPVCEGCSRTIAVTHRFVKCAECSCKFHIKHAGVSDVEYVRFSQNLCPPFVCKSCFNSQLPFADVEDLEVLDEEVVLPLNLNDDLVLTDKSCLNIGHLNINGLRSKIDFLRIFLRKHKFDILCLNETKIDSTVLDTEVSVPGYTIFRQDRNCHGGGVLIFAAEHLTSKKLSHISKKSNETLWVEIKRKKSKSIYVCAVYRPPVKGQNLDVVERYKSFLMSGIDKLPKDSEVFILGDFNCNMLQNNRLTGQVNDLCKARGLNQLVDEPTRITETSSTLIDLILSNSDHAKDCEVHDIGLSDHCFVCVKRGQVKIERHPKFVESRSFKNFSQEVFLERLGNLDWSNVMHTLNVDDAADAFNQNVLNVLNTIAPVTKKRVRESNPQWITEELLNSIKLRDYLKKVASRSKTEEDWVRFKQQRNFVINLKNRLKKQYFQNLIDENSDNSKKLWKTLNSLIPNDKRCNIIPHFLTDNGKEISNKKEIAETFNKFFSTIGSKLASAFPFYETSHICPKPVLNDFFFQSVSLSTVSKIISGLDNGKATGLDDICVKSLKAGSPILAYYLTHIFNLSLNSGVVPKCWKRKRVTPLFKKGDADDVNNYRPISILPIPMKVFEKIVHFQVSEFLERNCIISEYQSGFRNGHSTDTAVSFVADYVLGEVAKKKYVGAVLVDLKKAFDTVDHVILLKKLFCYGIRDVPFDWFESYLSDREQCSMVGDSKSSFMPEGKYGVPQGSVLGPFLFLLYINDIFDCIHPITFCHLYADDTVIIQSAKDPESLKNGLEMQLEYLSAWFYCNKLSVNTTKTEVIFFGRKQKVKECKDMPPLTFQNAPIEPRTHVKYLGVIFDEGLTWEKHASLVRQKTYLGLNKIKRVSSTIDNDTKRLLLNALVYPHLGYCVNTWSNTLAHVKKRFDSLSRQIDRITPMNKPFEKVVEYSTALMAFKAVNKICPTYLSNKFVLCRPPPDAPGVVTRAGAENKLRVQRKRNKFDSKTFLSNATNVWNNLPNELRQHKSVLTFKSMAKSHFFT